MHIKDFIESLTLHYNLSIFSCHERLHFRMKMATFPDMVLGLYCPIAAISSIALTLWNTFYIICNLFVMDHQWIFEFDKNHKGSGVHKNDRYYWILNV